MCVVTLDQRAETLQVKRLAQITQIRQPEAVDHRHSGLTQYRVQFAAQHHRPDFATAAGMTQKGQAIHTGHFQVTKNNIDKAAGSQHRHGLITVRRLQDRTR
ncbi:hypothetical protein D3C84_666850 [compost metagenome]